MRNYYRIHRLDDRPEIVELHWRDIMQEQQLLVEALDPMAEPIEDDEIAVEANPLVD